jgi:hypothetical protein
MLYGKFYFAVKGLCLLSFCEKFLVGMPDNSMQEFFFWGGGIRVWKIFSSSNLSCVPFFQGGTFLCPFHVLKRIHRYLKGIVKRRRRRRSIFRFKLLKDQL